VQRHPAPGELRGRLSALLFIGGAVFIVLLGLFPGLRPALPDANGQPERLGRTTAIQLVMM
jgi:anaerobic C4-dicarboxylate transporter DcuA/anaerobic C4-dicarboxylate transporter DcuB